MSRPRRSPNRVTADNADVADTKKIPPPPLPLSAPSAKSAVKNSEPERDDQRTELPRGWDEVALADLGLGRTEGIEPADEPNILFELWSVPSFPSGKPERVRGETIGSNKQRVAEGDVLLCKINPRINRVWVVGPSSGLPQIGSTEWIVFRSFAFDAKFLMWRFRENRFRGALCANMTGVGGSLTRARPKDVAQIKIALPPLAEQRRIVARLEALEARSRRARALLAEVPSQLAQARQSLLAAAFRGTLTADWRDSNPTEQKPDALITDLLKQRREWWEQNELEKFRRKGLSPKDDKWRSRYSPPDSIDQAEIESSDLPRGWGLVNWSMVSNWVTYGFTRPMPHVSHGVPIVTAKSVNHGKIDFTSIHKTTAESFTALSDKDRPKPGDILITKDGTIGRAAVVPEDAPPFCINQSVAVVYLRSCPIDRRFLLASIQAPATQQIINDMARGVAIPHLSITHFATVKIPLPPLPEQHEIVRRLTAAFARLDAAERAYASAVADLDRLDQALLVRAFSGTLVPQDAADIALPIAASPPAAAVPLRATSKAQPYLIRFIPALFRAVGRPLSLERLNSAVAFLFLPSDQLLPLMQRLSGPAARTHFENFVQPYEDGAFLSAVQTLLRTRTLVPATGRGGAVTLAVTDKLPPLTPEIEADARHLAPLVALIPPEAVAPTLERFQPARVREAALMPA